MFAKIAQALIQSSDHRQKVLRQHEIPFRRVQHLLSRFQECEECQSVGELRRMREEVRLDMSGFIHVDVSLTCSSSRSSHAPRRLSLRSSTYSSAFIISPTSASPSCNTSIKPSHFSLRPMISAK